MTIRDLKIGECDFICKGVHFRIVAANHLGEYTIKNVKTGEKKEGVRMDSVEIERYFGDNRYKGG